MLFPAVGANATICVGVSLKDSPPKERLDFGLVSSPGWGYYGESGAKVNGKPQASSYYGPVYPILFYLSKASDCP